MKLKELRTEANYTQQQLAEMLDVNQQTVARWENNKTEPSIAQLKDLAMIFGTSVDVVLGREMPTSLLPRYAHKPNNKVYDDCFYGYLGIIFHKGESARWFPVSEKVANIFIGLHDQTDWYTFETLNNRYVAVNLKNITYCVVNRDEADQPKVDWEHTHFENILPEEMYRGLSDYSFYDDNLETSSKYKSGIEDYIKEHSLDEKKVNEISIYTKVYGNQNLLHDCMWADDGNLASMFHFIELGLDENEFLFLTDDDEGNYYRFQNTEIAMIDSPKLQVLDAMEKLLKEMEEEED